MFNLPFSERLMRTFGALAKVLRWILQTRLTCTLVSRFLIAIFHPSQSQSQQIAQVPEVPCLHLKRTLITRPQTCYKLQSFVILQQKRKTTLKDVEARKCQVKQTESALKKFQMKISDFRFQMKNFSIQKMNYLVLISCYSISFDEL